MSESAGGGSAQGARTGARQVMDSEAAAQLGAARFRGRGFASAVFTLLVVLLPALVCGSQLDAPVENGEVLRLRAAVEDPRGEEIGPASLFYGMMLPDDVGSDLSEHVPRARLATVFGVLAISGMLYLMLALGRSRATGLLACATLACMPATANCTLRPEVPTAVFGMLATLILVCLPMQLRLRRRRSIVGNLVIVGGFAFSVGLSIALAVSTIAAYGLFLLVPGGCLLIAIALGMFRFVQVQRRLRYTIAPFWGFTRRTLPWFAVSFAALICTAAVLSDETESPTSSGVGLFPTSLLLAIPIGTSFAVGGVLWLLKLGLTIGRTRRVQEETVLFVFSMTLLMHRFVKDPSDDGLVAAPAMAVCAAIGLRLLLRWGVGQVRVRS